MNQLFFVWSEINTEQLTNLSAWSDRMRSSRLHQPHASSAFLTILSAKQWFGLVTFKEPPRWTVAEPPQQYGSLQHNIVGGLPLRSCSEAVLQSSRQTLIFNISKTKGQFFFSSLLTTPSGTANLFTAFGLTMPFVQSSLRPLFSLTNSLNPNLV